MLSDIYAKCYLRWVSLMLSIIYAEWHLFTLSDVLIVIKLNFIMTNVIMTNVIMTNVIMTNVIMPNVIMLNVIMLSVVAPSEQYFLL